MPVANPIDATHPPRAGSSMGPVWPVLIAISACHMVNDILQSLLSAIYPLLKDEFALSYAQIGWMTFAFQVTASLLQPLVGVVTDRRPMPRSLAIGMLCSFVGVLTLAGAGSYGVLLTGAMLIGLGSSIFHPESSRVARIASGGRFGTAQSLFQLGGNGGQAIGGQGRRLGHIGQCGGRQSESGGGEGKSDRMQSGTPQIQVIQTYLMVAGTASEGGSARIAAATDSDRRMARRTLPPASLARLASLQPRRISSANRRG